MPVFIGELISDSHGGGERLSSLFDSSILQSLSQKVHSRVNRKAESILCSLGIKITDQLHSRTVKDVVDVIMAHKAILAEEKYVPLRSGQPGALHSKEPCMRNLVKCLAKELMAISAREWSKSTGGLQDKVHDRFTLQRSSTVAAIKLPRKAGRVSTESAGRLLQRSASLNLQSESGSTSGARINGCADFAQQGNAFAVQEEAESISEKSISVTDIREFEDHDETTELTPDSEALIAQKDAEIADIRAACEQLRVEKDAQIRDLLSQLTTERASAERAGARLIKLEAEMMKMKAALPLRSPDFARQRGFFLL